MDLLKPSHDDDESKRVENIVTEFFSKSLHVILESRCTSSHSQHHTTGNNSSANASTRDGWFNLALRGCPLPIQKAGLQYSRQMVVDLVLLQHARKTEDGCISPDVNTSSCDTKAGKVIERWVMQYDGKKGRGDARLKGSSRSQVFHKKCVVMLRSLYVMLKLLPAYKVYRDLTASPKACGVSLIHYVSSFAEPFAREIEADMRRYAFEPVDSFPGRLCLSVLYLPSFQDFRIGPSTYQMFSYLIPDYFGADSVRRVFGCKTFGSGAKSSLNQESGFHFATQAKLPATSPVNSSAKAKETSLDGGKTEHVGRCQCSPALLASISPSLLARMSICPQHCLRKTEAQNPEERGNPLFRELSDNAVLGSLVNVFQTAAPLRLSSTIQRNTEHLPATADILTSSPVVKTAQDAIQELQGHIDMKKTILEKSSTLNRNSATKP